jgi:hypothetical protein
LFNPVVNGVLGCILLDLQGAMQRAAGGCGYALEVVGVVAQHYAKILTFNCCHFVLLFCLLESPAADIARRRD